MDQVIVEATADRPMYDYDAEYRRLRAAGHRGWAGSERERNVARMAEVLDRLEREFFPSPPAKVLELGCGNGMSSSLLMARKGYEVHGIDISESAIVWAGERFVESALSGAFRQGNVCEMPFFPEGSFDIVIDGSCLHCLKTTEGDAFRRFAAFFDRMVSSSSAACADCRNPMRPGRALTR